MARLTLNKPYALHARSIDRITCTPMKFGPPPPVFRGGKISKHCQKLLYQLVVMTLQSVCKSLQGNAATVAHKLCGGNRKTGTTAKRSRRGAAVATIGVQVLIAQPTDCCCCQVSHTTDLSYIQLNIKPGTRLIWGWLSRGMGLT